MILKDIPKGRKFFVAVVCVCFMKDGRIPIFQKRWDNEIYPGLWGFPAGKMNEFDKSIEKAAIREVHEETGNWVKRHHLISSAFQPTRHKMSNGEYFYFYGNVFRLHKAGYLEKIRINREEHRGYEILKPEEILKLPKKIFIPDALSSFRITFERYVKST